MNVNRVPGSEPFLSKRRLGWAGVAAFLGCALCCALPFLAVFGAGSGIAATVASFVRPGTEIVVGALVFALALGVMAARARSKKRAGCDASCSVGGACCDARAASGRGG